MRSWSRSPGPPRMIFATTCSDRVPVPRRLWRRSTASQWDSLYIFPTFSSFRGQPGLYLEDVYVRPVHRGRGIGKALLAKLAKLAMDRGLGRLEWAVLNWNSPAIGFYRSLGARPLEDWTVYRINDGPLAELAALAPSE